MDDRAHIFDLDPVGLEDRVVDWGMQRYRAGQVLRWVYRKGVVDVDRMTDLSEEARRTLRERLRFLSGSVREHQVATDGVQKLLIQWERDGGGRLAVVGDGAGGSEGQTECVMIPSEGTGGSGGTGAGSRARRTACISSQIGCAVRCKFCASGMGGLDGDLTAGRIVEQVWRLDRLGTRGSGGFGGSGGSGGGVGRITNVVFMGMGEPLSNFERVVRAVRTIMAPWGMGISGRRITISTVGLPAQIRRLADTGLPVTLAVSLHAPNDKLRRELIPWAEHVGIDQIVDAGRYYFEKTGREVTLEYILLGGVNDGVGHARELVTVAKRLRSNVNLIRYNQVDGLVYRRPGAEAVRGFEAVLRERGVNTHIRASRGRDIAAACGQLRREVVKVGGQS